MCSHFHLLLLTEPSLTFENLVDALKDVKDWSINTHGFPWCIDIPASKRDEIQKKYPSDLRQLQSEYIKYWLKEFPYPCWERICYALYWMEEYDVLESIQNKYFIGMYTYSTVKRLRSISIMYIQCASKHSR